jgi:hypothetical protein
MLRSGFCINQTDYNDVFACEVGVRVYPRACQWSSKSYALRNRKGPDFKTSTEAASCVLDKMWRIGDDKAYPFRHKHSNHFLPPPRYSQQRPLSPCFEEDHHQTALMPLGDVEEEVSIVFQSPIIDMAYETQKSYPLTQPLLTPPPFDFPSAPPLSSSAIAPENITGLLQDVLGIMNGMVDEQSVVQMEAEALDGFIHDLTQLVVLIQDEAMLMTEHAELVEEYVEEVQVAEQVAELEEWVFDLNLENVGPRATDIRKGRGGRATET